MTTKFTISSFITVFALAFGLSFSVFAQDTRTDNHQIIVEVPTVALLDLETSGTKNITASFIQPTLLEAGQKIAAPALNNTLWLNYSSIQEGTTTKRVDVKVNEVVSGVDINLVAGASATGAGTKGTPTAGFILTAADQTLVGGIGSAYTLTGSGNGHQLTYTFAAEDANYAALRSGSTTVTVTYTLADN
ncbi:hypothetical protein SAMN04487995_1846 [Dyadobacter koreensis]|uniref:Uncharacterized protein n=1 Tax=Dyadobacter koreensis TaxID=408657 RepID=A0A1H6SV55_9BACT|nr:hypothetical protein [Dyadobacter koreensis]SEI71641.1 hypothetical protein SAMN04487995_1846 [Dyadobacter koreensis]